MNPTDPESEREILEASRAFWAWFLAHESELRGTSVDDALIAQLEDRLFRVCTTDWEIGPDRGGLTCFSLAPFDQPDSHRAATALLACAPVHPQWTFTLGKPAREWDLIFTLHAAEGPVEIDAKHWEFVLHAFDDGTFDVVFKTDLARARLDDDELVAAATIILDGELGEATRRDLIGEIEVVRQWRADERSKAALLKPGLLAHVLERRRWN